MSNRMKLKVKEFKAPAAQQIFISVKSREGCANVHTNPLNRVKVEVTNFNVPYRNKQHSKRIPIILAEKLSHLFLVNLISFVQRNILHRFLIIGYKTKVM